jgi:hypothetical protein
MKRTAIWVAVAAGLLVSPGLRAQDSAKASTSEANPPEHFYRLIFTLDEINDAGKVDNSRSYIATIVTGRPGGQQRIRTGSRIPIATGTAGGSTQFQYLDLGVNFDVRQVKEVGDKVSSLAQEQHLVAGSPVGDPVIRQNRWDSVVLIPVGKPTVVFSADDLDSKGKMQVELTATRME